MSAGARGEKDASAGRRPARGRLRLPLAFVVGRYFVYVLLGTALLAGALLLGFLALIEGGAALPANYGEAHADELVERLSSQDAPDFASLSSAYRYAHLAADGATVLETDMGEAALAHARELAAEAKAALGGDAAGEALRDVVGESLCLAFAREDGTWVALSYELLPQWADRGLRDVLPNPQSCHLMVTALAVGLFVAGVALRASRVLVRKMAPLVEAADAVAAQDLDFVPATSNVAQIDDVLAAMDRMRLSLAASLAEQWAAEERQRGQVAALAHDLKTPLTVVRGNAELLLEGALDDDARTCAEAACAAAASADACVAAIIAASRGEAPARGEVRAPDLVRAVEARSRELVAVREGRSLVVACDAVPDATLRADADALCRAATNLVSNACDHTRGVVRLGVGVRAGRDAGRALAIEVSDDGPGFSPAALAHGRERFFRDDGARGSDGTHFGLGLAIADEAARACGGSLVLANRDGGGAAATLVLPLDE